MTSPNKKSAQDEKGEIINRVEQCLGAPNLLRYKVCPDIRIPIGDAQQFVADFAIVSEEKKPKVIFEIKRKSSNDDIWRAAQKMLNFLPRHIVYVAVRKMAAAHFEIAKITSTCIDKWEWKNLDRAKELFEKWLSPEERSPVDKVAEYMTKIANAKHTLEESSKTGTERTAKFFYRGQNKCFGKLMPSLFRTVEKKKGEYDIESESYYKEEEYLIYEAKRRYGHIFENCKSYIDELAVAQHYEIPTRLLDVTGNALVALYFATFNESDDEDGELYVFRASVSDFRQALEIAASTEIKVKDYHVDTNEKKKSKSTEPFFVFPTFFSQRQMAQDGSFIFFENTINPFKVLEIPSTAYIRIKIQSGDKAIIRKQLEEDCNIYHATLFPETLDDYKQKIINDAKSRIQAINVVKYLEESRIVKGE